MVPRPVSETSDAPDYGARATANPRRRLAATDALFLAGAVLALPKAGPYETVCLTATNARPAVSVAIPNLAIVAVGVDDKVCVTNGPDASTPLIIDRLVNVG